jgi:6-phosphogluconolactonase (cycloisomerase 2 family)
LRGQTGGGGYLLALKLDPESGKLTRISEKPSLSHEPCYTCLDKSKRYILVSHHADFGFVTQIVRGEKGFSTQTFFDDTALVLFRVNPDGSLGDACDLSLTPAEDVSGPHVWSRHHSVVADPSGELFIVCDKGLDRFHTYHLDRADGKLLPLQDTPVEKGFVPRYGVFHPTLPIFYANFEKQTLVRAYRYDVASGKLDLQGSAPLLPAEKPMDGPAGAADSPVHPKTLQEKMQMEKGVRVEPADILIHPSGRYIYASTRGANLVSVLDVDEAGRLSFRESLDCGGVNPRGLTISPDARFLFTANMDSGNIATFAIAADGSLHPTGTGVKARCPGSMRILGG